MGLPGSIVQQTVCLKSCVPGRILRTSSFSPESHQKEQFSIQLPLTEKTSGCRAVARVRKMVPDRYIKFIQYQPGGETFSFFCDSGEQLELLNFLPDTQDLGLTVCRMKEPGSPKRCLPVPKYKACRNARVSGTGPSAAIASKQKI